MQGQPKRLGELLVEAGLVNATQLQEALRYQRMMGGRMGGAMVALGKADTTLELAIGFIGVVLGAGNAVGGYVVTERMLEMFKSSKSTKKKGAH